MTVAVELATALHYGAQRVEEPREEAGRKQHYASRGPKPLPLGTRPARQSRSGTWLPGRLCSPRRARCGGQPLGAILLALEEDERLKEEEQRLRGWREGRSWRSG